jgi:hypothetical protein
MKSVQSFYRSALASFALCGLCSVAAAAGSLVVAPASASVLPGASFNVEVRGAGFSDNVVGGGFNLDFNPAVLRLDSVTVNTVEWEFLSNPGTIDNAAGSLRNVWFNAFAAPLPTGNFPIAVLSFTAKLPGSSALNLSAAPDFPFANDLAELIHVSYGSGNVNVSAVPELSSWVAMVLGLTWLGGASGWRRRRSSRSAPTGFRKRSTCAQQVSGAQVKWDKRQRGYRATGFRLADNTSVQAVDVQGSF